MVTVYSLQNMSNTVVSHLTQSLCQNVFKQYTSMHSKTTRQSLRLNFLSLVYSVRSVPHLKHGDITWILLQALQSKWLSFRKAGDYSYFKLEFSGSLCFRRFAICNIFNFYSISIKVLVTLFLGAEEIWEASVRHFKCKYPIHISLQGLFLDHISSKFF